MESNRFRHDNTYQYSYKILICILITLIIFIIIYYCSTKRNNIIKLNTTNITNNLYNNKEYDTDICSICLKDLNKNLVKTDCNHIFHKKCLCIWFTENIVNNKDISCPNCKNIFYKIP